MSKDFTKIVLIGRGANGNIFANIKFIGGRLSISGVEGPTRGGDCRGSCGQIVMHEWGALTYAPGWTAALTEKFRSIWGQWHLNDMKAGSPAQTAYLDAHPVEYAYPQSHYDAACNALRAAGLNPDPSFIYGGKPYAYGHAWLRVDVPEDVIAFLKSLPDTVIRPAWV